MKIVFDPNKDTANQSKHGVSLAFAKHLDWDWLQAKPDSRKDYGEQRMIGYAPVLDRVYCVVYIDRDNERRIVSLRKANKREVNRYEIYISP
jgi:uncharacterized DUF497 family protein